VTVISISLVQLPNCSVSKLIQIRVKSSAKIPGPSLYEVLVPSQLRHVIAAQIRRYRHEPTHQPKNNTDIKSLETKPKRHFDDKAWTSSRCEVGYNSPMLLSEISKSPRIASDFNLLLSAILRVF